ncbi:MAG: site-specific DNA-methyltransferase [Marivita sp.]|uniref:site-specific DNA-methyltransferase n=1 Tax=Marivita sp. TaxID=2003365 RepID=UPI001B01EEBE|nr:site-specific DNA-methyltransferase [Marivita sp.]MBO6884300.1 site-specific DNA-methyltransferase [Marivita sp.]
MTLAFAPERIEHWPLARLQPYAKNAKMHGNDQVAKIAASMAEFGWTVPCLVGEDGELIAGHGRVLAATQLGLAEAPVIVLGHLTEAQRRAYRIADNKLTELGTWDEALLSAELQDLLAEDYDLSLIGFDDGELDALLSAEPEAGTGGGADPDEVPEPAEDPVSRPGDLWLLGGHRLLCGDATVTTDVERLLDGARANLTFCDPPYNVDYAGGVGAEKAGKGRRIKNDALGDGFGQFLYDACVLINAHTDGAVYICMSSSELQTLQTAFKSAGGHWSTFIIWAKDRFTLGRSDYQRQYEPILYGWPERAKRHWCGDRDQGDVWQMPRPHKNDLHPTMKPVALVERALRNSSQRGDLVLDPFGGSGTTLIAAEATGRRAALLELDPKYIDVIIRRWQDFTGREAQLSETGQTFEDVAPEREAGHAAIAV